VAARDELNRKFEQLEAAGKRVTKILYPSWLAEKLGIAREGNSARYQGRPASPHDDPHKIVIKYNG
jgi:hypothetical protein